jgi:hypothetical protein
MLLPLLLSLPSLMHVDVYFKLRVKFNVLFVVDVLLHHMTIPLSKCQRVNNNNVNHLLPPQAWQQHSSNHRLDSNNDSSTGSSSSNNDNSTGNSSSNNDNLNRARDVSDASRAPGIFFFQNFLLYASYVYGTGTGTTTTPGRRMATTITIAQLAPHNGCQSRRPPIGNFIYLFISFEFWWRPYCDDDNGSSPHPTTVLLFYLFSFAGFLTACDREVFF